MNETIQQDERYPEWMKAWNAKAAEIDEQIISYFTENTEQTSEAVDNIGMQLQGWWDKQTLDDVTRAEYLNAKSDAKLFTAKVENRITHLVQDGKIKWAKHNAEAGK